jgi:hypothetical protein
LLSKGEFSVELDLTPSTLIYSVQKLLVLGVSLKQAFKESHHFLIVPFWVSAVHVPFTVVAAVTSVDMLNASQCTCGWVPRMYSMGEPLSRRAQASSMPSTPSVSRGTVFQEHSSPVLEV